MSLEDKYNTFYEEDSAKLGEHVSSTGSVSWPKNRVEAIGFIPGTGDVVLDIGCGDGQLLFEHRERFTELWGLEYSSHRLAVAEKKLKDFSFRPIAGSAEAMTEIESSTVDRIVSADVIEHIPDVFSAVDEMYRVLKPGADIVINTPNVAFVKKRVQLLLGFFPSTSQANEGLGSDVLFDGGHLHYFTFRSLSLVMVRSGFQIRQKIGYGPLGRVHNIWPSLLSGGVQLVAEKPLDG